MVGVLIELLVCVLLATTIGYCVMLDRRLRRLKADEETMRRTIVDLVAATDKAERAVGGLRAIVDECDQTIATHLREAERYAEDLAIHIRSGDDVIARIARIVESARGGALGERAAMPAPTMPPVQAPSAPAMPVAPVAAPAVQSEPAQSGTRLAATLAAAQAFADRAHRRVAGQAA